MRFVLDPRRQPGVGIDPLQPAAGQATAPAPGGAGSSPSAEDILGPHIAEPDPHAQYVLESLLNELIDDRVAALLVAGSNITLTYNDPAGTLTVAASGGGGSGVISYATLNLPLFL